ncbi:MarR family winged helix-turn-helix transcriptional regulator [Actinosynnema mirum]|uniref:Transcriptional regulator, MarR family n=1 Tax=Actinosynnema mirum (strain ATCC 29888 / DSM 43827 / JCM 3225 / NBRC 14064 / NCIMB 13271 / NRRL B-12336 / IMRU 3971 / 101) TaxID=446462 RepID=C6WFR0_ACTMD|nr:MarR family transcriptional regulator [Actinosynnema mirum]ACU37846.1 transcriptional regulator, MarR family [Actinosynnema mirum DSM 43827]
MTADLGRADLDRAELGSAELGSADLGGADPGGTELGSADLEADGADAPRWLDGGEMAAWLALLRVVSVLPQALDRQLRDEVGISHTYYSMLAVLSDHPDRTLSMGELARLAATSPSRLTHAIAAMEKRGWVRRRQCGADRRVQYATLTDEGLTVLRRVAPAHVAEVRRLVFDRLDPQRVEELRVIASLLADGLAEECGTP